MRLAVALALVLLAGCKPKAPGEATAAKGGAPATIQGIKPDSPKTASGVPLIAGPNGKPTPVRPPVGYSNDDPNKAWAAGNPGYPVSDISKTPSSQPAPRDPNAPLPDGQPIFVRACASCHGMDGSGSMMRQYLPNIGDLTSKEMYGRLNDQALTLQIQKGKGKMPPFESVLKPYEIQALVVYLHTLQKK